MQKNQIRFLIRSSRFVLTICALLLFEHISYATSLPVGGTLNPPTQSNPFDGNEQVKATSTRPFHGTAFDGILLSTVYQEDTTANPLGGLTFVYTISNNSTSTNEIHRFTISDFTGFSLDAGVLTSTGVMPAFEDRTTGDVFGASFLGTSGHTSILPGQSSAALIVRTNAPIFDQTAAFIIDGSTAVVNSYAPHQSVSPPPDIVPEPGSGLLLGSAMALIGLWRWRRGFRFSIR